MARFASLALLCAALIGCKADADFSDSLHVDQLPAEDYRGEIASIDRMLFRPAQLTDDDARDLAEIIDGLSNRVAAADPKSRYLHLESLELQLFAKRAGRLSGENGSKLQDNWMRIRNNLFDDRAWFVRSANDLYYAASVVPDPRPAFNGRWQSGEATWTFDLPRLTVRDATGTTKTYTCAVEEDSLAIDNAKVHFERGAGELRLMMNDREVVLQRATPSP